MTTTPALEFRGVSKVFGPVRANDGISFSVARGTIHAVIGENGAGKSTAMKILYGLYHPDGGEIQVFGQTIKWKSPLDAIGAGIGMVHQHFMLAGPYTALDNVILGAEPLTGLRQIDRANARAKLEKLSEQYKLPVEWDRPIEELSVGVQQRVEILKLLYRDSKILILDEPTAVLTPQETHELFQQLRRLCQEGRTVIVVTHKLREVMDYTDHVTVFRAGKVTGERKTSQTSPEDLAELMVGRRVILRVEREEKGSVAGQAQESSSLAEVMRVEGLGVGSALSEVSFSLRRGEILGVAGVEGNGQSELLHALMIPHAPEVQFSKYEFLGKSVRGVSTRELRGQGLALIPEDRHREGVLLSQPLTENYVLGHEHWDAFATRGIRKMAEIEKATTSALERHDVRPRIPSQPISKLSGGNQQKLIIARELDGKPRVLIAAQPTRGVDVGAIESIHQNILAERKRGVGVLLVSSELDELLSLSDRLVVLYRGRIVAEYKREEFDEQKIGLAMGGASQ